MDHLKLTPKRYNNYIYAMHLYLIGITWWFSILTVNGEIIIERNLNSPDRIITETEAGGSFFHSSAFYDPDKSGYQLCKDLKQGYGRETVTSLPTSNHGASCYSKSEVRGGKSHIYLQILPLINSVYSQLSRRV